MEPFTLLGMALNVFSAFLGPLCSKVQTVRIFRNQIRLTDLA